MFTLRIIEETRENEKAPFEQSVTNHSLGSSYAIFAKGESKIFKEEVPDELSEGIKAVLFGGTGGSFWIRENTVNELRYYFIMTDSGKTFEKL
jgi:hypothetical protein